MSSSASRTSRAIDRTTRTRARQGRGFAGMMLARGERGQDLGGDPLELIPLLGGVTDRIQQEVGAAGRPEALELLQALRGRPDHAVLGREGAEVLGVAGREPLDPSLPCGLVVAA